jgi:hypothetical protein
MTDADGSFVRWQTHRIEQFGVVTHLLLGPPPTGGRGATLAISMVFLFGSVVAGLWLAWNRLGAFRLTAHVARQREQGKSEDLAADRARASQLDRRSWRLLKWQLWLFALGGATVVGYAMSRLIRP